MAGKFKDTKYTQVARDDLNELVRVMPDYSPNSDASPDVVAAIRDIKTVRVGSVTITVEPSDSIVQVDGRDLKGGSERRTSVLAGTHVVYVARSGYEQKVERVTVITTGPAVITVALSPVSVAPRQGRLMIQKLKPSDANVFIDDQPLPPGRTAVTLSTGDHYVRVHRDGYEDYRESVSIQDDQTFPLTADLKHFQFYKSRRINWKLPRVLTVRADGAYQMSMEPFAATTSFAIYGKSAEVTSAYDLGKKGAFDGYGLGATVRVWKYLSVGGTRTHVKFSQAAEVQGTIPDPTPTVNFTRDVTDTINNISRKEDAFHLEIGATAGNARGEATVFAGPSWLTTTQDVITKLSIIQSSSGPSVIGASGQTQSGESRIGINVGADLALYLRYVGFGATFRYVRSDTTFNSVIGGVRTLIPGGGQVSFGLRLRY